MCSRRLSAGLEVSGLGVCASGREGLALFAREGLALFTSIHI